jgi:uncharacterized protein with HEPN domain
VRDDRERLADVLAAIDRIRRYVQDDRTRFDTDELLQSAVLHWIEIIGEAARGVGDKVRTAHPDVPWRVITDMRNRVSHGYFDIRSRRRVEHSDARPAETPGICHPDPCRA